MTPAELRDKLRDTHNIKPGAKVLVPWIKGVRQVADFHVDQEGNLVLDLESVR